MEDPFFFGFIYNAVWRTRATFTFYLFPPFGIQNVHMDDDNNDNAHPPKHSLENTDTQSGKFQLFGHHFNSRLKVILVTFLKERRMG